MTQLDRIELMLTRILEIIDKPKVTKKVTIYGLVSELDGDNRLTEGLRERLSKVTLKTQRAWVETYGDELIQELLRATTWLEANPRRQGNALFYSRWLLRSGAAKGKSVREIELD